MSRHRNIRNKNYNDELSDEDYDYGRSYEEEVAMSPSASQFMYHRSPLSNYGRGTVLSEFIPEERSSAGQNDDIFAMDDVHHTSDTHQQAPVPQQQTVPVSFLPPPGFENAQISNPVFTYEPQPPSTTVLEKVTLPVISNLRVAENPSRSSSKSPSRNKDKDSKKTEASNSATPTTSLPSNSSSHRLNQLTAIASAQSTPRRSRTRIEPAKQLINLVVVGHVDAGKSTLMGHLLCLLGCVDQRTIHKYKQESARSGKASFAFAWVLDETEEERSRGVTMDIAKTTFETANRRIMLLDAPGHKDFVPNMISGASQADAAILVVNSTRGEFETGFENGGQTREHAMLLRSLGVSQLVVAINKLDTVDWSEERFNEVKNVLNTFLTKQAGYSRIRYVPVSGLTGENIVERVNDQHILKSWYNDECLVELIDTFVAPNRSSNDGPLRIVVNDVFKATPNQLSISGKIESGEVMRDDKVFIMPNADAAVVKACSSDDASALEVCASGDHALLTLQGTFEPDTYHPGHVIVRAGPDTLIPGRCFSVRLVVFDVAVPIMKGTRAELFCHALCQPVTFVKLVSSIDKSSGQVLKQRPRCLSKGMSGIVHILTENEVAIEPYTVCKALGRVTFRANGQTIAAGIIEKKIE